MSVELPQAAAIGEGAFEGSALESVRLSASASVGERAFANTKLKQLVIPTAGSFPLSAVEGTSAELRLPADATDEQLAAWNETLERPWYDPMLREGEVSKFVKMPFEPTPAENFEFDPDTGLISAYIGSDVDVVVPREIDGVTVVGFKNYNAFDSCQDYTDSSVESNRTEWVRSAHAGAARNHSGAAGHDACLLPAAGDLRLLRAPGKHRRQSVHALPQPEQRDFRQRRARDRQLRLRQRGPAGQPVFWRTSRKDRPAGVQLRRSQLLRRRRGERGIRRVHRVPEPDQPALHRQDEELRRKLHHQLPESRRNLLRRLRSDHVPHGADDERCAQADRARARGHERGEPEPCAEVRELEQLAGEGDRESPKAAPTRCPLCRM